MNNGRIWKPMDEENEGVVLIITSIEYFGFGYRRKLDWRVLF